MKRRNFVKKATISSLAAMAGTHMVFADKIPKGYVPLKDQDPDPFKLFGLDPEMSVLNNRPWNIEAKAHLLDEEVTSDKYMFIRNNGIIPTGIDMNKWEITFDGESIINPQTFSLAELKSKFPHYTYQLTLECRRKRAK